MHNTLLSIPVIGNTMNATLRHKMKALQIWLKICHCTLCNSGIYPIMLLKRTADNAAPLISLLHNQPLIIHITVILTSLLLADFKVHRIILLSFFLLSKCIYFPLAGPLYSCMNLTVEFSPFAWGALQTAHNLLLWPKNYSQNMTCNRNRIIRQTKFLASWNFSLKVNIFLHSATLIIHIYVHTRYYQRSSLCTCNL
jgi:hypothetical protein